VRKKYIHIEIDRRYNLIHEKEGLVSLYLLFVKDMVYPERKTYYKWKKRYKQKGIKGLLDAPLEDLTISSTRK
jgi:hypothetical protein